MRQALASLCAVVATALPSMALAITDLPRRPDSISGKCIKGDLTQSHIYSIESPLPEPCLSEEIESSQEGTSGSPLFLQRDPNGYEDSVNLYAGFRHDPINLRDPTGMSTGEYLAECLADPYRTDEYCHEMFGEIPSVTAWQSLQGKLSRAGDAIASGWDAATQWIGGTRAARAIDAVDDAAREIAENEARDVARRATEIVRTDRKDYAVSSAEIDDLAQQTGRGLYSGAREVAISKGIGTIAAVGVPGARITKAKRRAMTRSFADRAAALRKSIGGRFAQGEGNVGFAQGTVNGKTIDLAATSGRVTPAGTVGNPQTRRFATVQSGAMTRDFDTEVLLLEDLAAKIPADATGTIWLFTEKMPCRSCGGVIDQFRQAFPGVDLRLITGQ